MLYTGDFRWEADSDKARIGKSQILSVLQGNELDFLYLDNTYCNPLFSFPPRDVVAQQVHFFYHFFIFFIYFSEIDAVWYL